jgi:prepilin-type N-terminal cleavage/methylation domain-containing protein
MVYSPLTNHRDAIPGASQGRGGFTIVEMLVVAVIMAMLAGLMLAGLSRVRHRAKVDKTKSTIRKIHEVIMPQYEGYLRRRVPFVSSANGRTNALNRLIAIRRLIVREMPDNWSDVFENVAAVNVLTGTNSYLATGPVRAYAAAKSSATSLNGSAECLFLIVSRGNSEPYVMEQFRQDEVGDADGDGAPEFLDGWNQPIILIRWAPGFSASPGTAGTRSAPLSPVGSGFSVIQFADPERYHDPFDPLRVDAAGYALVPLVASGGANRLPGLQPATGWAGMALQSIVSEAPQIGEPVDVGSPDFRDNITNHDFSAR